MLAAEAALCITGSYPASLYQIKVIKRFIALTPLVKVNQGANGKTLIAPVEPCEDMTKHEDLTSFIDKFFLSSFVLTQFHWTWSSIRNLHIISVYLSVKGLVLLHPN